ncbi:MAG TPA: hypothetical protein VFE42_02030 [Chloroflexota bacterium]|nr:hypothetical protein [Chloroflexota bacterium]
MAKTLQIWELWVPEVAAQGLCFARARLDATDVVLVHAAGARLTVEVHDDAGRIVARGNMLERTADTPMARLRRQGDTLTREDIWPAEADYGTPVILAGGEVGLLRQWWNAPDHSEWRWSIELYNHR